MFWRVTRIRFLITCELLCSFPQLTNAIKHSLEQTGGVRHDGLLGLEMYLSDQQSQPTQAGSVPTVTSHTLEPPGIYSSDGESYESCLEVIGGEERDYDNSGSEGYTDTVDSFHPTSKCLNTWL